MIDLLFIGLLQAVAGAPDVAATETPPAAVSTTETATTQGEAAPAPQAAPQRVCRTQTLTGSRVRRARICTTASEDAERQRTLHGLMNSMQNSHAAQAQKLETGAGP